MSIKEKNNIEMRLYAIEIRSSIGVKSIVFIILLSISQNPSSLKASPIQSNTDIPTDPSLTIVTQFDIDQVNVFLDSFVNSEYGLQSGLIHRNQINILSPTTNNAAYRAATEPQYNASILWLDDINLMEYLQEENALNDISTRDLIDIIQLYVPDELAGEEIIRYANNSSIS